MKKMYGLTKEQMIEVYEEVDAYFMKNEVAYYIKMLGLGLHNYTVDELDKMTQDALTLRDDGGYETRDAVERAVELFNKKRNETICAQKKENDHRVVLVLL